MSHIKIIPAGSDDLNLIIRIHRAAFNSADEAELTSNLIEDSTAQPIVSLLAYQNNIAVGHILFTKANLKGNSNNPFTYILAPLAVIPEYQNHGIGGLLIKKGLDMVKDSGAELVFVLGHIKYYPKFGFIPNAAKLDLAPPYPIAKEVADAWMVKELKDGAVNEYSGTVLCAKSLDKEEYWRE